MILANKNLKTAFKSVGVQTGNDEYFFNLTEKKTGRIYYS